MDDESEPDATTEFFILADGKELWRSGTLNKGGPPVTVNVPLNGAQKLTLRTSKLGAEHGQTDWIGAKAARPAG